MFNLLARLTRDDTTNILQDLNITCQNTKRCDILHRKILIEYFEPSSDINRKSLQKVLKKCNQPSTHPLVRLKILMMLHFLLINTNCTYSTILDQKIQLPKNYTEQGELTTKLWLEQACNNYYSFLQKVSMHDEIYQKCKKRLRSLDVEPSEAMQQCYAIMNLIKQLVPIKEFILNFGRYFHTEYLVVADLNRILAADICKMYVHLSFVCEKLTNVNCYQAKMSKQQCRQLVNLVDEVYLIHQEIYVFLYNRYYFNYIESTNVQWFKLDTSDYEKLKTFSERKDNEQVKNLTVDDINLNDFERTYVEAVTGFGQRLGLGKKGKKAKRIQVQAEEELPQL